MRPTSSQTHTICSQHRATAFTMSVILEPFGWTQTYLTATRYTILIAGVITHGHEAVSDPGILCSITLTYLLQAIMGFDIMVPGKWWASIQSAAASGLRSLRARMAEKARPVTDPWLKISAQTHTELAVLEWEAVPEWRVAPADGRQPQGGLLFQALLFTVHYLFGALNYLNICENRATALGWWISVGICSVARVVLFVLAMGHVCLVQPVDRFLWEAVLPAAHDTVVALAIMAFGEFEAFLREDFGVWGSLGAAWVFMKVYYWCR